MSTHDCNWSQQFKNIYVHVNNQEWLGWTSQLNLIDLLSQHFQAKWMNKIKQN
jgi:hypothetical protein